MVGLSLAELYREEPAFRAVVDRCAGSLEVGEREILLARFGTTHGQPLAARYRMMLLYTLQNALVALWAGWGVRPDIVLGHRAGILAAAVCAGAMSLEDGMLAATRSEFALQPTEQIGSMPGRTSVPDVALTPTTRPLLTTAGLDLKSGLTLTRPDLLPEGDCADDIVDAFRRLERTGAATLLEIGPGRTFDAERCDACRDAAWVSTLGGGAGSREALTEAVASLYVAGCRIDFAAWHRTSGAPDVDLPLYAFDRQTYRLEDRATNTATDQRTT